jgi:hypothetical protein
LFFLHNSAFDGGQREHYICVALMKQKEKLDLRHNKLSKTFPSIVEAAEAVSKGAHWLKLKREQLINYPFDTEDKKLFSIVLESIDLVLTHSNNLLTYSNATLKAARNNSELPEIPENVKRSLLELIKLERALEIDDELSTHKTFNPLMIAIGYFLKKQYRPMMKRKRRELMRKKYNYPLRSLP